MMKKEFPKRAVVACQGISGSNSEAACRAVIPEGDIMFMSSFEAVFSAVESGLCDYGILPVENSIHGSVTAVYDLMKKRSFRIVRAVRQSINHALLANEGARLADIREIVSHPQALAQCSEYLAKSRDVTVKSADNTAVAARTVAESGRKDIAAIADASCASLYGLRVIKKGIQDSEINLTRFVCIAKEEENYPDADRISVMFTLPNKPNALCEVLTEFASLGLNLTKIESRPVREAFEFMFYLDFEASMSDSRVAELIEKMREKLDYFEFLGNYREL